MNKLDESKKPLGKCILAKGVWHFPPEFEVLGGKRSKRWRYSLLYLGRRLSDYDITCPGSQPPNAGSSSGVSSGAASVAVGNVATSAACTPVTSLSSQDYVLTSQSSDRENIPSPTQPMLVNSVLSFIKAFRLMSDKDSLKRVVADRFSSADVDSVKRAFWNFCHDVLLWQLNYLFMPDVIVTSAVSCLLTWKTSLLPLTHWIIQIPSHLSIVRPMISCLCLLCV